METVRHSTVISVNKEDVAMAPLAAPRRTIPIKTIPSIPSIPSIPIIPHTDANKVVITGLGIKKPQLNRQNMFQVDCSRAGNSVLFVGVFGPDCPCDEVYVKHLGDKVYSVAYTLQEKGQYILYVKWGDDHVQGSPFFLQV